MLSFCAGMASRIAMPPMTNAAMRATLTSSFSVALPALPHRRVEVVGHRGRRRERQAGHHGEDRREGDRGDEGQQDRAAGGAVAATDFLGEEWRGQVARGRRHLAARSGVQQRGCAEAQHQRHQVEAADDADRPVDRRACVLGRRHRVEADQDVRQPRRTEDQGQAEGQEVDLAGGGGAVLQARAGGRPRPCRCCRRPRRAGSLRLKSNFASTSTVIRMVPLISSTALTICTQVVPFMPPTVT